MSKLSSKDNVHKLSSHVTALESCPIKRRALLLRFYSHCEPPAGARHTMYLLGHQQRILFKDQIHGVPRTPRPFRVVWDARNDEWGNIT